jgi:hypothetical protein
VKRRLHEEHARRRRIIKPSFDILESTTRFLRLRQNGHRMV